MSEFIIKMQGHTSDALVIHKVGVNLYFAFWRRDDWYTFATMGKSVEEIKDKIIADLMDEVSKLDNMLYFTKNTVLTNCENCHVLAQQVAELSKDGK